MPALDRYFETMLEHDASDLHLSVGYPAMLRVKGDLVPHGSSPLDEPTLRSLLDELLDERLREQFHEQRDLDFAYSLEQGGVVRSRFRCNYLYKHWGSSSA